MYTQLALQIRSTRRFAGTLVPMAANPIHVGVDGTTWSNDRGFGRFTRELIRALAKRSSGFRYTLLFDRLPAEGLPEGIGFASASTKRVLGESTTGDGSRSISYLWKLGSAARKARFDVFFFPAVYSYFPILAQMPCVVCYHDTTAERMPELLFPNRFNNWLWKIKTALARIQTTRAMTVSQSSADDLVHYLGLPASKIDLVTEAADPVFKVIDDPSAPLRARARFSIPGTADLLVYIGGFNRHKNVVTLIKAMPEIINRHPRAHLAIVGSTSGKGFWDNVAELRHLVESNDQLKRHCHFTGRIDDAGLVELLNGAAALVFPSLWEGFGLPAVEAMSCGVPVLASNRSSLPEVIANGGLFFEPESAESIAGCVSQFLGDTELRRTLSVNALRRARDFSWERAAELAEDCFRKCHQQASQT